ncbi:MAG: tripartite tricarboxylate transporter substrate binding protein [Burkholderiales bacterium]
MLQSRMGSTRFRASKLVVSLVGCLIAASASAQSYPVKPVRIVVPLAAGGGVDNVARAFAQKYSEAWKQPVIVENRPGAGNIIGAEHVAKSAPDGYTLLASSSSLASNAVLFKKLPFDAVKDFAPVTQFIATQLFLAMNPKVPANNVRELIAYAKAQPGKLNYGSTGIGSGAHLISEMLKIDTGIDVVHVPYKGDAPLMPALLGGEIQFGFLTASAVLPHVKTGRLRALAVSGRTRVGSAPDLPTMMEAGVPTFEFESWIGLFAPAGTPLDIQNAISAETARALKDADMIARLPGWGGDAVGSRPEAFAARYRGDIAKLGKVVSEARIPLAE